MARILLVDDDPLLVQALKPALEQGGHHVTAAPDGRSAIRMALERTPDLMLLDLRLPDMDGVDVVRRLRSSVSVPVLILSAVTDERRKAQALDAGADDFLNKPFGMQELAARIRVLERRGSADHGVTTQHVGDLQIDIEDRSLRVAGEERRLTPTQWKILRALMVRPGALVTHRVLVGQVWGYGRGTEPLQSLRTHMGALRAKLGDDAQEPRYILTESGMGYRWLPGPGQPAPPADADGAASIGDPTARRTQEHVVHDLNNVLTAMRFAAHLATERETLSPQASREPMGPRLEGLVQRAVGLVAELQTVGSIQSRSDRGSRTHGQGR